METDAGQARYQVERIVEDYLKEKDLTFYTIKLLDFAIKAKMDSIAANEFILWIQPYLRRKLGGSEFHCSRCGITITTYEVMKTGGLCVDKKGCKDRVKMQVLQKQRTDNGSQNDPK